MRKGKCKMRKSFNNWQSASSHHRPSPGVMIMIQGFFFVLKRLNIYRLPFKPKVHQNMNPKILD